MALMGEFGQIAFITADQVNAQVFGNILAKQKLERFFSRNLGNGLYGKQEIWYAPGLSGEFVQFSGFDANMRA